MMPNPNYYPMQQRIYPTYDNPQQQQQTPVGLKGRPVSSIEEARAITIDFDGSLHVFPDLAHQRIYTKQIGMDGTAILNIYSLDNSALTTNSNISNIDLSRYVTKEELHEVREEISGILGQFKQAFQRVRERQEELIPKPMPQQKRDDMGFDFN